MAEMTIEEQAMNAENVTFGDDRLGVIFYNRTVEDPERTKEEGRKCFKTREFIKIMVPGDRMNIIDRPVQRTGVLPTDDVLRFSRQYEKFKAKEEQAAHDGLPLSLWPAMPGPLAEELKHINVFTVEQLATLSDTYVGKVPMGHAWKKKAEEFVKALTDQAQVSKLQAALAERDARLDAQDKALKDQAAIIEKLQKRLDKLEK